MDRGSSLMRRVEQQVIEQSHPQYRAMDALAFASKNLWNLANYHVRQSFLSQHTYLTNSATFHLLKETEAYQALPAKVANQVLLPLIPQFGLTRIGDFARMQAIISRRLADGSPLRGRTS